MRINRHDKRFSITFPITTKSLIDSFRTIGQLYPIIVKREGELFTVIDGFRRLEAANTLGFKEIKVIVVPDLMTTMLDYYLQHLYAIIATRLLNEIEKAQIIRTLSREYAIPDEEIQKKYAPLIDSILFPHYKEVYDIVLGLPDELKMYLYKKNVRLQNLMNLWNTGYNAIFEIIKIAMTLQLGGNKIKIFSAFLEEISFREKLSIIDIVSHNDIQEILLYDGMSGPQKWEHLFRLLHRIRYPEWSKIEKELQRDITNMKLPDNLKFSYPEYLEGDELEFRMYFRSPQELKSLGGKILTIADSDDIRKIFQWFE